MKIKNQSEYEFQGCPTSFIVMECISLWVHHNDRIILPSWTTQAWLPALRDGTQWYRIQSRLACILGMLEHKLWLCRTRIYFFFHRRNRNSWLHLLLLFLIFNSDMVLWCRDYSWIHTKKTNKSRWKSQDVIKTDLGNIPTSWKRKGGRKLS